MLPVSACTQAFLRHANTKKNIQRLTEWNGFHEDCHIKACIEVRSYLKEDTACFPSTPIQNRNITVVLGNNHCLLQEPHTKYRQTVCGKKRTNIIHFKGGCTNVARHVLQSESEQNFFDWRLHTWVEVLYLVPYTRCTERFPHGLSLVRFSSAFVQPSSPHLNSLSFPPPFDWCTQWQSFR